MGGRGRTALWVAAGLLAAVAALLLATTPAAAAWTSPGTGVTYTMASLDSAAGTNLDPLPSPPSCNYHVHRDITISDGDTLIVDAGCRWAFDNSRVLDIRGRLFVNGTAAAPVIFESNAGGPGPGAYPGLLFTGAAFAPSAVNNLSVTFAVNGVLCDNCDGLSLHNVTGNALEGDMIQVVGGGRNVTIEDVRMVVTVFTSQSVVALQVASDVTGRNVTGTQAVAALLVWNSSNVSFDGPLSVDSASYGTVWVDSSSNVTLRGLVGAGHPYGLIVTRSQEIVATNLSFEAVGLYGALFANVTNLSLGQVSVANATGDAVWLDNVTRAGLTGLNLSANGTGLGIIGSSNVTVDGVAAQSAYVDLWVSNSTSVLVTDADLSGAAQVGLFVNGSTGVQVVRLSASGASVGALVDGSAGVSIRDGSLSLNGGDGLAVTNTADITVERTSLTGNGRRGASFRQVTNLTLDTLSADANGGEGVHLSTTQANFSGVVSTANGRGGIVLEDASTVVGSALTVSGNNGDGLQVDPTSLADVAGLTALANTGNGTRVDAGGALRLSGGWFENNTLFGIYTAPGGAVRWAVVRPDEGIVSNDAVLEGSLNGSSGGTLRVASASLAFRSAPTGLFLVQFTGGSTLLLEAATLQQADGPSSWALDFTGGSTLDATDSTLSHPGSGTPVPGVSATGSTVRLVRTQVSGASGGVVLNQSTALFRAVDMAGGSGGAITARANSVVTVADLRVAGLANGVAVLLEGASSLEGTDLNVSGAPAEAIVLAGASTLDVDRLWAEGLSACAVCLSGGSAAIVRNGTIGTSGATPAVGPGPALDLRMYDTRITSPAGPAVAVNASVFLILLAVQFTSAGPAVDATGGAWIVIRNSTLTSTASVAVAAAAPARVDVQDSVLDGALGGLIADFALFADVHRTNLSAASGVALRIASSGIVRVTDCQITAGPSAVGVEFDNNVFNASNLTVVAGVGATGVHVVDSSGSVLVATTVTGAQGSVGISTSGTLGLTLRQVDIATADISLGVTVSGGSLRAFNVTVQVGASSTGLRLDQAFASQLTDVDVTVGPNGTGVFSLDTSGLVATRLSVSVGAGSTGVDLLSPLGAVFEGIRVEGGQRGVVSAGNAQGLTLRNGTFTNQTEEALRLSGAFGLQLSDVFASPGRVLIENSSSALVERLEVRGTSQAGLGVLLSPGVALVDIVLAPASGLGLDVFLCSLLTATNLSTTGGSLGVRITDSANVVITGLLVDGAATSVSAEGGSIATLTGPTLRGASLALATASGVSTLDIFDGVIGGSAPGTRHATASGWSSLRLYDTPADNSTFEVFDAAAIEVFWTLTLAAQIGGLPVAGISIALTDAGGAGAGVATTGANGTAAPFYGMEFRLTVGGRQDSSPYRAAAVSVGGFQGALVFNLDRPRTIVVDLMDIQPPWPASRSPVRVAANTSVDFAPDPGDFDNVGVTSYSWQFLNETGALIVIPGPAGNHSFPAPGRYDVTVTLGDAAGNTNSTSYEIWVNAPPFFASIPGAMDLTGIVDIPFIYTFDVSDADLEDIATLVLTVQGLPGAVITGNTLEWTPSTFGEFRFTVRVSDGNDAQTVTLALLVEEPMGGANQPPTFVSTPRLDANIVDSYVYRVQVADPENEDVIIQLVTGPAGMTLVQPPGSYRAELTWEPGLYFRRGADAFNFTFEVSLRASDLHTTVRQDFVVLLRNPPDIGPEILYIELLPLAPGDKVTIDLDQFAFDKDDPISTLTWALVLPANTHETAIFFNPTNPKELIIEAPNAFAGDQSFLITLNLTDSSGKWDHRAVQIQLEAPSVIDTAFPWILLIALIATAGAAYAIATRQRHGMLPGEAAPAKPATPPTTAPAAAAEAVGSPLWIQCVALFDTGGRLHQHVDEPDADVVATLVGVQATLKGATVEPKSVQAGRVEDAETASVRVGENILVAVGAFAGNPSPWLLEPMERALSRIQVLAQEEGTQSLEQVADSPLVHEALAEVLALGSGSSLAAVTAFRNAATLRVASVAELLGGAVRLKVAVDNGTSEIAADVRLSLEFDDKVMRFERMEPDYESKRDKVQLGNLRPGERKTVAFTFDPQVCSRTFFNATAAYEDALGKFQSVAMRTRPVEVVCPAFSTTGKASTGMLMRLLRKELAERDAKYFRFSEDTTDEEMFAACKESVGAHNMQFVRELVEERPYKAEAWFYGETKVTGDRVLVWTTVHGKDRVVQFTVASNNQAAITGLLAELGRQFAAGPSGIEVLTEESEKKALAAQPSLLSKTQEGELGPDDS